MVVAADQAVRTGNGGNNDRVSRLNRLTGGTGAGLLPESVRAEVTNRDLLLLEEGLTGSIALRNYHSPGTYVWRSRQRIRAAIAITANRLVIARNPHFKELDVPRDDRWRQVIAATVDRPGVVCISWQVGAFHADRSGTEEVRLRTSQAQRIVDILIYDASRPAVTDQMP